MYGCESWTIKKAEHRRIDAFEFWCWRRLLRVPWTAWRSNQSILKEISPEYWLEGLMLKLKLQYFGHLMRRIDSLEKTLILEKIEGRRGRADRGWGGWMASLTRWTWVWASSRNWWWAGRPGVLHIESQRVRHNWATELNWTESVMLSYHLIICHLLLLLPSVFPSISVFPVSWLFPSGTQNIGTSASASVLPMNIQGWFFLAVQGTLKSLWCISSSVLSLLYGPTLTGVHDYWKNHSLDYTDLCQQSGISAF